MKTILTCTDGSVYANSVYDHTAWAATRAAAEVLVLHMLDPERDKADLFDLSGNLLPNTRTDLLDDIVNLEEAKSRVARERGRAILAAARERLLAAGVERVVIEQQHGRLVEAVTRLERERNADLVIVGKRGEAADFDKLHLGSNLERVIRGSSRPVLVTSREFKPIKRFLVAYDGGPSIEKAIQFALKQPLLQGLECRLVRAGKIDDKAQWYIHEAAGKLRDGGFVVEAEAINGTPEAVIAEQVKSQSIDLLLMGAYGHSRIRNLMIGSTTTEMVRTCHVPVLMFR